jgi:hypothetical protein
MNIIYMDMSELIECLFTVALFAVLAEVAGSVVAGVIFAELAPVT